MNMILHNLKVAIRNLMKYKLQTAISVLSIAVGIVTLSFTHSLLSRIKLPSIYYTSYYDHAYKVTFKTVGDGEDATISKELIKTLKRDGGLRSAEMIAVPNGWKSGLCRLQESLIKYHMTRKASLLLLYVLNGPSHTFRGCSCSRLEKAKSWHVA